MLYVNMPTGFEFILVGIALVILVLPIVSLVDIIKRGRIRGTNLILWILLLFFAPVIGSVLYWSLREKGDLAN